MKLLISFLLLVICSFCRAENMSNLKIDTTSHQSNQLQNKQDYNPPPPPESEVSDSRIGFLTQFELILSISVLVFSLLIISLEIFLIKNKKISSDNSVKFILVTLIITATLFLITAGYNNNQIAPAIGLFGTAVGYLLGKANGKITENED